MKTRVGYVYYIKNMINGRAYVGSHLSPVFDKRYWGSGDNIKKAIKKHGKSNFRRRVLFWGNSIPEVYEMENYFIKKVFDKMGDRAYNIALSATHPMAGRKHSEKTIQLYKKIRIGPGNPMFGVSLVGEKNGMFGKKHSQETKEKIAQKLSLVRGELHGNYGKKRDSIVRAKMSASKKGKHTANTVNDVIYKICTRQGIFCTDMPLWMRNLVSSYRAGVWQRNRTIVSNIDRFCKFMNCVEYGNLLLGHYRKNSLYYKEL